MSLVVSKRKILFALLLVPIFKPSGLEYYPVLNTFFLIWKMISLITMLFLLIFDSTNKKFSIKVNWGFIGLCTFWTIYILNNIRNQNADTEILNNAVFSLMLFVFISKQAQKKQLGNIINTLSGLFKLWFWIQIISILLTRINIHLFGTLVGDYLYFLGTDNYSAFMLIPMIGIIMFNDTVNFKTQKLPLQSNIYIIIYTFINLYTKSYTAFFGGIIIILMLVLYKYFSNILKLFTVKNLLILSVIFLILIVVFNIQNFFSSFLENILQKGISLSSRTYIWSSAINVIKKNLVWGVGSLSLQQISSFILYGSTHTHNIFLELLFRTGIWGTVAYIIFIIYPLQNKRKQNYILTIFFIGQIILFIMDFYVTIQYFYCFMAILYNLNYLENNESFTTAGE